MNIVALVVSLISSFVLMEFASWFIHKYLMHGPLWNIHKSHHQHQAGKKWELNDLFSLFFTGLAIYLLIRGLRQQQAILTGAGLGISLYGITYFVVHDVFIHRRIKLFRNSRNPFIKALAEAHYDHHKSHERRGGKSFGLLLVGKEYYQKHFGRKVKKT